MAAERSFFQHALRTSASVILLGVAGCVSGGRVTPPPAGSTTTMFDPIAFFAGRTHGTGRLHVLLSRTRTTDVRGNGVVVSPDTLVLDQDVVQGSGAPKHRRWQIRRVAPGRYAGTLTDAIGPVAVEADGNRLHIAFTMRGGLAVEQRLYLQPGGRVALNAMTVRKLGIVVGRLDERIERVDRP